MQTKKIKCPNCDVVLEVKNSKNETVKQITCPQCKAVLKVNFPPEQEPIEAKTYYAPPKQKPADNGATQYGGVDDGTTRFDGVDVGTTQYEPHLAKKDSSAQLVYDGQTYDLEEGQNIVGRKGTTSKATVQIETTDRYMSRQHCSIKVTTLPDGTKKVVLSNYQNKNATMVNGQKIETGDEIRLTDGNSITMGHTTIIFNNK